MSWATTDYDVHGTNSPYVVRIHLEYFMPWVNYKSGFKANNQYIKEFVLVSFYQFDIN